MEVVEEEDEAIEMRAKRTMIVETKIINFKEEEEDDEAITQPLTNQCQQTSQMLSASDVIDSAIINQNVIQICLEVVGNNLTM